MKLRSKSSLRLVSAVVVGAMLLVACGDDKKTESTSAPVATGAPATDPPATDPAGVDTTLAGSDDPLAALYQECLDNGAKVNLIALPDDWANYKGILESFRTKYPGVENPVSSPDASSKEEMEAVQTLAGQDDMPDNVDVSPAIAQAMVDAGLFEPYVVSTSDEIPDGLKDADNNWTAAYFGIMAIATNTTIVPNAPHSEATRVTGPQAPRTSFQLWMNREQTPPLLPASEASQSGRTTHDESAFADPPLAMEKACSPPAERERSDQWATEPSACCSPSAAKHRTLAETPSGSLPSSRPR